MPGAPKTNATTSTNEWIIYEWTHDNLDNMNKVVDAIIKNIKKNERINRPAIPDTYT